MRSLLLLLTIGCSTSAPQEKPSQTHSPVAAASAISSAQKPPPVMPSAAPPKTSAEKELPKTTGIAADIKKSQDSFCSALKATFGEDFTCLAFGNAQTLGEYKVESGESATIQNCIDGATDQRDIPVGVFKQEAKFILGGGAGGGVNLDQLVALMGGAASPLGALLNRVATELSVEAAASIKVTSLDSFALNDPRRVVLDEYALNLKRSPSQNISMADVCVKRFCNEKTQIVTEAIVAKPNVTVKFSVEAKFEAELKAALAKVNGNVDLDAGNSATLSGPAVTVAVLRRGTRSRMLEAGFCGENSTWYLDKDVDGYVVVYAENMHGAPTAPKLDELDCDDSEPQITSHIYESSCGQIAGCTDRMKHRYFEDSDGDGHGAGEARRQCVPKPPPGFIDVGGDCDDSDPTKFPGNPQVSTSAKDHNCDGKITRYYLSGNGQPVRLDHRVNSLPPDICVVREGVLSGYDINPKYRTRDIYRLAVAPRHNCGSTVELPMNCNGDKPRNVNKSRKEKLYCR